MGLLMNRLALLVLLFALGCDPAPAPYVRPSDRPLLKPDAPEMKTKAPDRFKVRFTTSQGAFTISVDRSWAPQGADRFYHLVRGRFYDDARFFRVVSGFVCQFGIPADPAESALWKNANIPDDPRRETNTRGKVTYATAGPGTRTTQLFINYSNGNRRLDNMGFSPFGEVTEGMDVVDKFYSGYREEPDQKRIESQGNPYLQSKFPKLDYIQKAEIID
jgi:cyclophilin family peptidyl-prolyl cis-trans isomerase